MINNEKIKRILTGIVVVIIGISLLKVSYGYWTESLVVRGDATLKFQVEIEDKILRVLKQIKTENNRIDKGEDHILSEEDRSSIENTRPHLPVIIPKLRYETQTIDTKDTGDSSITLPETEAKIMTIPETEDNSITLPEDKEKNNLQSWDNTRGDDTIDK